MMKILCVICAFSVVTLHAQNSKYGGATKEELSMTSYDKDPSASAVVLFRSGELVFQPGIHSGMQSRYTYKVKIKILKPEGLKWCNQTLPYLNPSWEAFDRVTGSPYALHSDASFMNIKVQSQENITSFSGATYNLEGGKIVKTKLKGATDEDLNGEWVQRVFAFKDAKVGSVIEYSYTMTSEFLNNIRDFYFQEAIPVEKAIYTATIPDWLYYRPRITGNLVINKKENSIQDGDLLTEETIYQIENVPALQLNDSIAPSDQLGNIHFELNVIRFGIQSAQKMTTSWEDVDLQYLNSANFAGKLAAKKFLSDNLQVGDTTLTSANALLTELRSKVKWNKKSGLTPGDLKQVVKKAEGTNADLNFLLIDALSKQGFKAYPVILSTRDNGKIVMNYPEMRKFNAVITGFKIGDKAYFVDAADVNSQLNVLPPNDMVSNARSESLAEYPRWYQLSSLCKSYN